MGGGWRDERVYGKTHEGNRHPPSHMVWKRARTKPIGGAAFALFHNLPTLINTFIKRVQVSKPMSDLLELTKKELIALCEEKGLDTSGTKSELVARLEAPTETVEEAPTETVEESLPEASPEPVVEEVVEEPTPAPKKAKKATKTSLPDVEDESISNEEFVKQAYLSILKREADAGGLKHYVRCLEMHRTLTREQVLERLADSEEAKALK